VTAPRASPPSRVAGFRTKLLVAMMLLVSAVTALGLYVAERNVAAGVERDLQRDFQTELDRRHNAEAIRQAALTERCRALVRKPRIQQSLEEALDILYDNAENELSDLMENADAASVLHAKFYRFLNAQGAVIAPPPKKLPVVGTLQAAEEARLALPAAPDQQQIGFLARATADGAETIFETIATPIRSS
jgi:hypothetical protein